MTGTQFFKLVGHYAARPGLSGLWAPVLLWIARLRTAWRSDPPASSFFWLAAWLGSWVLLWLILLVLCR